MKGILLVLTWVCTTINYIDASTTSETTSLHKTTFSERKIFNHPRRCNVNFNQSQQPGNIDASIQTFAFDLFEQITNSTTTPVDTVISPFSAQTILALLLQGASGTTAQELITGLDLTGSTTAIAQNYQTFLAPLQNDTMLKTANKIYLAQGSTVATQFNEIATTDFYASAETVNFADAQSAADTINTWVAQETNNLIQNLIPASALSAATKMVLINAISFKGLWATQFDATQTEMDTFNTTSSTSALIDIMHITSKFNYGEISSLDAAVIEFPYANSSMSMFVVLPNDVDGLANLEINLKSFNLSTLAAEMAVQKVIVSFPKFTTTFSVTLNDALINMGMTTMFTSSADFSNLLEGGQAIDVSAVIQKAYIEVDEQGAQAAAATGVVVTSEAITANPKPTPVFNANHPFVYWIQNGANDPFFIGHFLNSE